MSAVKVASLKDLLPGKAISVLFQDKTLALFNVDGKVYAMGNECTHAGAPLCEGEMTGTTVTCPWHGATFNVCSGEVLSAPAYDNVATYKVIVEGDDIKIEA